MPSGRCRSGQSAQSCKPGLPHLADFQAQGACVDWAQQQCGEGPTDIAYQQFKQSFKLTQGLFRLLLKKVLFSPPQTGGRYKWVDNWLLSYTKWGTDEPKHNYGCVYMDVDGKWKTAPCSETHYSLCKRSPGQTFPLLVLLQYTAL